MKVFVVAIAFLVATALAAPSISDNKIESDGSMAMAMRFVGHCMDSDDVTTCLAVKGITALNRAARSNNLEIVSGVTFTREATAAVRGGKSLSENDVLASLPAEAEERTGRLLELAAQSVVDFFGSHKLELKVPAETTQELARSIDEGRGKMKKLAGPLLMALGAKLFAVVPLVLGGLALLTFKAVIVAKIALLLALAVGASKIFGGAGGAAGGLGGKLGGAIGGNSGAAGWSAGNQGWSSGAGSYPYARSLGDAHNVAYQGQMPADAE